MNTYNIWKYCKDVTNIPTGPWVFMGAVLSESEQDALETAKSRYGLAGTYKVYEGV